MEIGRNVDCDALLIELSVRTMSEKDLFKHLFVTIFRSMVERTAITVACHESTVAVDYSHSTAITRLLSLDYYRSTTVWVA